MVIVRLLVVLYVIGMLAILGTFFYTKDKRWLRFGWQITRFSLLLAALVGIFYVVERIILL